MTGPAPAPPPRHTAAAEGPPADVWRGEKRWRKLAVQFLRVLPVQWYGALLPRWPIGLCYHLVSDGDLPHVRHLYRWKSAAQFEHDLRFLQRHYRVVSYDELRTRIDAGKSPQTGSVFLSFDDGYRECWEVARPLLRQYKVPCTFFVTPAVLDNRSMFPHDKASLCIDALERMPADQVNSALAEFSSEAGLSFADLAAFARWVTTWIRTLDADGERVLDGFCVRVGLDITSYLQARRPYLTSEQVRSLAAEGFTIGGHALRHVAIGSLHRPEEVEAHVVGACRHASGLAGTDHAPFAFPFDANGVDRDLLGDIRARHPSVGLFFDTRQLAPDRPYVVNRMITDAPPRANAVRTNLPTYLRGAYLDEWVRRARANRDSSTLKVPSA